MRMDRYDEDLKDLNKKTRTDKNQELYTDVYLNNAYVDIKDLSKVMNEKEDKYEQILPKLEEDNINYTYVKKNYDINEIIKEAIENHGNDNIKRSLEDNSEIDNIIESINESHVEKEENEDLLSDLMPDSDTTTIVSGLSEVVDTQVVDTSVIHKDDMSNEILESIENDEKTKNIKEDLENDLEFEEGSNKKLIFIIISIVIVLLIVLALLYFKGIIKL